MKSKIIRFLFSLALILMIVGIGVQAGSIDYTDYTEVDGSGLITVAETQVDFYGSSAYVANLYNDYGAGYFDSDYTFTFKINYSRFDSNAFISLATFTNTAVTAGVDWFYSNVDCVIFMWQNVAGALKFYIKEKLGGGSLYSSTLTQVAESTYRNTDLWCKVFFDDDVGTYGTFYFYIYTNEAMTILLASNSLALHEENSWQYYSPIQNAGWGTYTMDLTISNGAGDVIISENEIQDNGEEFIDYSSITDTFYYYINGEIIESNGIDAEVYLYYSRNGGNKQSQYVGDYQAPESFEELITGSYGDEIEYYFGMINAYGTDVTDNNTFTMSGNCSSPPTMTTVSYPRTLTANGTESVALLYGIVDLDGCDNVTGYIQYSENTTDWTDSNPYAENLTHGDWYSINITSLNINQEYFYRAKGVNGNGTGYGAIASFTIYDWADPIVDISHSNVLNTSADLTIELLDDGNEDEIWVVAEYRQLGQTAWTQIGAGTYISINETAVYHLTDLNSSTTYQYRAYGFGECYKLGYCDDFSYSNIYQFTTNSYANIPSVQLDIVGYYDSFTLYGTARVINDSGRPCTISLEFKPYGSDNSHWARNILLNPSQYCDSLFETYTCTTYITNLNYGSTYDVRARIQNDLGYFSYSNIITYTLQSGTTSTTPGTGDMTWLQPVTDFLEQYNLNNTGGKLLVIFIIMMLVLIICVFISGNKWQENLKISLPIAGLIDSIVMVFGMVVNFVPVIITAIIITVFCGVIAIFVIKTLQGRGSEV